MRKRGVVIGLTLLGLLAASLIFMFTTSRVEARPMRLVIIGPEGQRFSGSYVADGVTNSVSALAPATISLRARDVAFEFEREGGDAEFRVAMFVGDKCRTSTTSDKRKGVRGVLRYSSDRETYWAAGF